MVVAEDRFPDDVVGIFIQRRWRFHAKGMVSIILEIQAAHLALTFLASRIEGEVSPTTDGQQGTSCLHSEAGWALGAMHP